MAHIFNADMECNVIDEFYNIYENNGTIAASNEQARTGTYSLKANVTIAGGHAYAKHFFRSESLTELYFRFYYYLPTATYDTLDVNGDSVVPLYTEDEDFLSYAKVSIRKDPGGVVLVYSYRATEDTCACPSRDAWHGVELYFKRDAVNGAFEWWVDGVSQGSGSGLNTGAKNLKNCTFGNRIATGATGAIYIDNMVISTSRIYELMGNIPQGNALRNRKETPQGWII